MQQTPLGQEGATASKKTSGKKDTAPSAERSAEPAFEAVIARLDEIVAQLEQAELPLERVVELFEEGMRLTQVGVGRLDEAERRVNLLLEENGKLREVPFDSEGGGES